MIYKRIITIICLIFFFHGLSISQTIDEMGKTVVFLKKQFIKTEKMDGRNVEIWIRNPNHDKPEPLIENIIGTGFIIIHNNRNYLVTAKHVSVSMDSDAEIIMNSKDGRKIEKKFKELETNSNIKNAKWFFHPIADIALFLIPYYQNVDLLAVRTKDISREDKELKLLSNVYILGFPLGLGLHEIISPIAKRAQLASNITSVDMPNLNPKLKFYLIDQAIAQGYSGAPVYYAEGIPSGIYSKGRALLAGETTLIIGLVSGSLSDRTGGKISLVVPISYLWDILESEEFKRYEKSLK